MLRELQRAASYGLEVQDYAPERIAALSPAPPTVTADAAHLAQFDVKLSLAALRFMSDLHYGRVDPAAAGFKLSATHQPLDLAASLIALARSADVSATIASFASPTGARWRRIASVIVPGVPPLGSSGTVRWPQAKSLLSPHGAHAIWA